VTEPTPVTIRVRGQEFKIRTNDDADALHRVADYLDETMSLVEARTGTVDSLDLALLTALNLARELVELRDDGVRGAAAGAGSGIDEDRLAALIERAEEALEPLSA
jgi:cell division protein ZapA (FtsZ GTPase activity inhibitor)